jgi:hypothetical protein
MSTVLELSLELFKGWASQPPILSRFLSDKDESAQSTQVAWGEASVVSARLEAASLQSTGQLIDGGKAKKCRLRLPI